MTDPKIIDIGTSADPEAEPKKSFNFRPLHHMVYPLVCLPWQLGLLTSNPTS